MFSVGEFEKMGPTITVTSFYFFVRPQNPCEWSTFQQSLALVHPASCPLPKQMAVGSMPNEGLKSSLQTLTCFSLGRANLWVFFGTAQLKNFFHLLGFFHLTKMSHGIK